MAIIAQGNNWWIESFIVTLASVADTANRITTHTLERSGVYLGHTLTVLNTAITTAQAGLNGFARNTDNSQLQIGQNITALETLVLNDSGGAASMGETLLVFLRKP